MLKIVSGVLMFAFLMVLGSINPSLADEEVTRKSGGYYSVTTPQELKELKQKHRQERQDLKEEQKRERQALRQDIHEERAEKLREKRQERREILREHRTEKKKKLQDYREKYND